MNRREFLVRSSMVSSAAAVGTTRLVGQAVATVNDCACEVAAIPPSFPYGFGKRRVPLAPEFSTKKADLRRLGPQFDRRSKCFEFCPPDIESRGVLCGDRGLLKKKVLDAFGRQWSDPMVSFFTDNLYYLPTCEEVRAILAASVFARLSYRDNRFDCDDFAFGVKSEFSLYSYPKAARLGEFAFAFGVVAGGFRWPNASDHAACFFVSCDFSVYLVEPREPWRSVWQIEDKKRREFKIHHSDAEVADLMSMDPPPIDPNSVQLYSVDDCTSCRLLLL